VVEGTEAAANEGAFPSGIVTFLFTDVEGSTRLWAEDRDEMSASLQVHDRALRDAVESQGGYVFTTAGDSFAVAFGRASEAVAAANAAQAALADSEWPGPMLRVRMGLHVGEAEERGGDYFGPVVNTTARLEAAGHGGQVLMTDPVRQAAGVSVRDLGFHVLRDVPEPVQIWQLGDGEFPPLRVVDPGLTNLPAAVTGLVGRAEDSRRVREALSSFRVVTLTAAGGTGKTRLALNVGEQELPDRPDGARFVDLTPVSDGALVPAAVAAGLGLGLVTGDPIDQILDYVADKDLLLIVDNCEHLIDDCAELAERFLTRPGASALLATSRERFEIDGEQVIVLPPLAADDTASAAVELFAQRATALDSSLVLSDQDRSTVVELCQRLDGMPLAIELAAARSTVLTPAEMLAGIEDRFALLGGGRRRQRRNTLQATLDWSYDLLDDGEQTLLRALGVFVGTFDLDAVAAVGDLSRLAAVDLMDSLVAKSLIIHEKTDGTSRFRLLETTSAYADQRLSDNGEQTVVRDRHLDHYHRIALSYPLAMIGDIAAGIRHGPDRANIAAAFEWAATHDRWTTAAQLLLGLFRVFNRRPFEGIEMVDRCVEALPDDEHDLGVRLVCNQWILCVAVADYPALMTKARWLRGSSSPVHQLYGYALIAVLYGLSDPTKATPNLERASEILYTLPAGSDTTQAAAALQHFACLGAMSGGEPGVGLEHAREAARLHDELGFDSDFVAQAWMAAALCAVMLGEPEGALELADRFSQAAPAVGTGDEIRALVHLSLGDLEAATGAAKAHAQIAVSGRITQQATESLLVLAALAAAKGDRSAAERLLLSMGTCRMIELIAYSRHLADQLGIRSEFETTQIANRTKSPSSADDTETLRQEMARLGW
jgi:predicted ATPase/class 3 adenylate cyclase